MPDVTVDQPLDSGETIEMTSAEFQLERLRAQSVDGQARRNDAANFIQELLEAETIKASREVGLLEGKTAALVTGAPVHPAAPSS